MDGEELFEHCRKAADVGLSMTVHAIGDRANHEVLNAYEQLRKYETEKGLPHLRHRIEHVQIIHPDDAPRLAKLNVIASMQPIHATSDMFAADRFWGERSKFSYAWRTQLNHGAPIAFGSDAPSSHQIHFGDCTQQLRDKGQTAHPPPKAGTPNKN
jgi:predicted amidohydrolase YtcJ